MAGDALGIGQRIVEDGLHAREAAQEAFRCWFGCLRRCAGRGGGCTGFGGCSGRFQGNAGVEDANTRCGCSSAGFWRCAFRRQCGGRFRGERREDDVDGHEAERGAQGVLDLSEFLAGLAEGGARHGDGCAADPADEVIHQLAHAGEEGGEEVIHGRQYRGGACGGG